MKNRITFLIGVLVLPLFVGNSTVAQDLPCPGETRDDLPDGYVVIEGDIIMPADYCLGDGTFIATLWPNGVVPFAFSGNVSVANQQLMLASMALWEAVADVEFRPFAGELSFVFIQDSTGNNSAVGKLGGIQFINIFNWNSPFIIAHELAHTLGFWHEQSRPDRVGIVQINFPNICQNCCSGQPCDPNFAIQAGASTFGPYDFDSVMHYGQFAFSIAPNVLPTITVLAPNTAQQGLIGQRVRLSYWDKIVMSFIYPFGDWVFVDQTAAGTLNLGTFPEPFIALPLGLSAVPNGGTIWLLDSTSYTNPGVITDAVTIEAPLGGVVIGA